MSKPAISERLHIALFGRTNVGKSSLINAITNQELAIVSNIKGTTADPVQKSIELLPLGPVVFIDTAGIDDETNLGKQRIKKTYEVMNKTDIAVVVLEYGVEISTQEKDLIAELEKRNIVYIKLYNKADNLTEDLYNKENPIYVSSLTNKNINKLKDTLASLGKSLKKEKTIVKDLVEKEDTVILVTPIDEGAPKGRLILPQQMVIRELVENNNNVVVLQPSQLQGMLGRLKTPPALVITDSQAFGIVDKIVPQDIPLTSFSILMAKYKGSLAISVEGVKKVSVLQDGSSILISEGCSHHQQCDDIGRYKIPKWLNEYTKKDLKYSFTSGGEFPEDLSPYDLVIHCGGCMLNDAEMISRMNRANNQKTKITNYGILISLIQGSLKRSIKAVGML